MTVRGPIAREQGINFFAVARTDPSAFMRRYYQRVGERYLSAEGESMRFEVGLFFKKRPTERCEMFETRPRRIETQTPQKHERELVTLEILLRRQ
jgi:hypothetical protein